jgi:hypothetical protein
MTALIQALYERAVVMSVHYTIRYSKHKATLNRLKFPEGVEV